MQTSNTSSKPTLLNSVLLTPTQLYRRGALMVIGCGFFWSTAGFGVRMMSEANGWQIVFYRSIGLSIILLAYLLWRHGKVIAIVKQIGWLGVLAGTLMGSSFFGNIFALIYTSVANVTFILSTAPFMAALLGWFLLKERVRKRTWLAIAFTAFGVLVMINGGLSVNGFVGIGFAFFMALCYAFFTIIMRHNKHIDMVPAALVAGLSTIVFSSFFIDSFLLPWQDIVIALALGVGQMGLGLILFIKGSRYVPAAELTLLTMLEVILSPLWVWLLFQENPGIWTLVGGGVIMVGILIQATGTGKSQVSAAQSATK